jgi:hypothetical protein
MTSLPDGPPGAAAVSPQYGLFPLQLGDSLQQDSPLPTPLRLSTKQAPPPKINLMEALTSEPVWADVTQMKKHGAVSVFVVTPSGLSYHGLNATQFIANVVTPLMVGVTDVSRAAGQQLGLMPEDVMWGNSQSQLNKDSFMTCKTELARNVLNPKP